MLFTAEIGSGASDDDLQFLADGVIQLDRLASGRVCAVTKMRGPGSPRAPTAMGWASPN